VYEGLTAGELVWIGVGLFAVVAIAANMKELLRYIRIASM
jgi:hypothetical protein